MAERSAHVLATTEAVTGLGLAYLRRQERRIADSSRQVAALTTTDVIAARLDAKDKSLLELSPFILDLLTADAHRRGRAVLLVDRWHGLPFLADFALRARSANLVILGIYADGEAAQAGGQSGKLLVDGNHLQGSAIADAKAALALADAWLQKRGTETPMPLVSDHADLLFIASAREKRHDLDLPNLYREIGGEVTGAAWQSAAAWAGKFDDAIKGHILANRTDFNFFNTCVSRIWAPTSERSRGQQG